MDPQKLPLKEIFQHNHCHGRPLHYSIFSQKNSWNNMMTSQENVSDAFPLSTFQWSKLWVICNNSQFWFSWSWLLMNESKLQHMAYKHCVQNQSKKLVFLPSCPILSLGNILMDHNFHNVYNRKGDALERWVSFSYRDGFTHRPNPSSKLHSKECGGSTLFGFTFFCHAKPGKEV